MSHIEVFYYFCNN
ncbi:uncharacterized protein FFE2_16067 [Fusarium fujikuroi]|nr:uncharacterized protein FFE2_16067 [Fusarium fujikuroi]